MEIPENLFKFIQELDISFNQFQNEENLLVLKVCKALSMLNITGNAMIYKHEASHFEDLLSNYLNVSVISLPIDVPDYLKNKNNISINKNNKYN